jgi:hypothetical protein
MSSVLKQRSSNKESVPYENESTKMPNSPWETQELDQEENLEEEGKPEKSNWLLILAVHLCNVMYSSCFWINIGIYPVWQRR